MLIVIIAIIIAAALIFIDYSNEEQQGFNYNDWIRSYHQPEWSREKQDEQDLEEMMQDPANYWQKYV